MNSMIVGAGISLLTAIVAAVVAFIFQYLTESRKRKWQLEDVRITELIAIRKKRFGNVEELLQRFAEVGRHCTEAELKALDEFEHALIGIESKANVLLIRRAQIAQEMKDVAKEFYNIYSIGSKDFDTQFLNFMGALMEELDIYDRLCEDIIGSKEIDIKKERERVSSFRSRTYKLHGEVVAAIDKAIVE
jgi:hypothetical protein